MVTEIRIGQNPGKVINSTVYIINQSGWYSSEKLGMKKLYHTTSQPSLNPIYGNE